MFFKKKIVASIGYNGAIIAFHTKNSIVKKFFFEKFDADSAKVLEPYFAEFKRCNISILLDTVDQTYKKKNFPSVRKSDLRNLARRELGGISSKDSLKSFITQTIVKEKKRDGTIIKKWQTILITASLDEDVRKWIDFLFDMPNMIEGIYAAPIESFTLINKIKRKFHLDKKEKAKESNKETKGKKKKKNKKKIKPEENSYGEITCLIIFTKINGFRQVFFSKHGIEFTRIVNYDTSNKDFIKNYEQDIYSSFEYLKRSFSDIDIKDIKIINILSPEVIKKIETINNDELHIKSYTPNETGRILGLKEGIITKGSEYSDLLLSRSLFRFKKILRFRIPKMIATSKMYMVMVISYYFYLFLIIFFFVEFLININIRVDFDEKIDTAEVKMFKSTEKLHRIQNKVLNTTNDDGKNINIEQAIDIGKINDVLEGKSDNIFKLYEDMGYIKKYDAVLSRINYYMEGYNEASPIKKTKYSMSFTGKIYNKTGNIDDLFKEFDDIYIDTKEIIKGHGIKFSKIPRNIDFNKKYYEFPLDFTISSK